MACKIEGSSRYSLVSLGDTSRCIGSLSPDHSCSTIACASAHRTAVERAGAAASPWPSPGGTPGAPCWPPTAPPPPSPSPNAATSSVPGRCCPIQSPRSVTQLRSVATGADIPRSIGEESSAAESHVSGKWSCRGRLELRVNPSGLAGSCASCWSAEEEGVMGSNPLPPPSPSRESWRSSSQADESDAGGGAAPPSAWLGSADGRSGEDWCINRCCSRAREVGMRYYWCEGSHVHTRGPVRPVALTPSRKREKDDEDRQRKAGETIVNILISVGGQRSGPKHTHTPQTLSFFFLKAPKHTLPPQTPTRTALANSTRTKSCKLLEYL